MCVFVCATIPAHLIFFLQSHDCLRMLEMPQCFRLLSEIPTPPPLLLPIAVSCLYSYSLMSSITLAVAISSSTHVAHYFCAAAELPAYGRAHCLPFMSVCVCACIRALKPTATVSARRALPSKPKESCCFPFR